MKHNLLALLLLLISWSARAQSLTPTWSGVSTANPVPGSGPGNTACVINASALDASGNLYVTGYYSNTVNFPTATGSIQLVGTQYTTMFVGKWSTSTQAWVWVTGNAAANGSGIAVSGNAVYVTGNFGGGSAVIAGTTLTNANAINDSDGFLAKYIDNGSSVSNGWAIQFGSPAVPSTDEGRAIAISGNNLYLTGRFYGTANIAGTSLTAGGQADFFLAKYDLSTTPATGRWAVGGGSVRTDQGEAIAVSGNNIYVGGNFASTITLGSTTLTTTALNDRNLFLAKYVDNGTSASNSWAIGEGGTGTEGMNSLKLVGSDIFTTGGYGIVGANIAGTTLTGTGNSSQMYVAKYTDAGSSVTGRWATGVTTGTNGSAGNDLEVSGSSVFVTGTFSGNATVAGSALVNSGTIGGEAFLARYTDNGSSVAANGAIAAGSPTDSDQGYSVHLRGTTVYVTGYAARSPATFGNYTLSSTGISTVPFIARASIPAQANVAPTVTTAAPSGIVPTGAVLGGDVTANGGATVSARGVVYSSTNTLPTISDTKVQNGSGNGSFSQTIMGLAPNTTYYVRAYATNSVGTGYGSALSFMTMASPTSVVAINRASTNPTGAGSVAFTVSFASPVSGLTISNFVLATTGLSSASISSLSGSGTTYTVTVNTGSGSGTLQLRLATDTGVTPGLTNLPFTGETYTVDKTPPLVSSVGVPANGTYRIGQILSFTVNFSETTTVTGTPQLGLTIGSTSRAASYVSGSGSSALVFTYALQSGEQDTDGIALAASLALNGGSLRDAVGNNATLTLNGVGSTANVLVDAVAPVVNSVNRQNPTGSLTNATALIFRVSFSEPVSGVTIGSFALTTTTGSAVGTIASVAAVSGSSSQYDVIVSGVSGPGALRLDVKSSGSGISDAAGNTLSGGFTSGQIFTIDQLAPTVTISSLVGTSGAVTRLSPIPFSVSFSESVTGFGASGVSVTNGTLSDVSGSGAGPYSFQVIPLGNGLVTVSVGANKAQDAAGNGNTAASPLSIDYQPLTITGFTSQPNPVCAGSPLQFTATVSNASGPYGFTLTSGNQVVMGSFTGTAFSQSLFASGAGLQSFTLTLADASQTASATQAVTVNPLPVIAITDLASAYCQNAPLVTLTGLPTGGSFTIDGSPATSFNPAKLLAGSRSVVYTYTNSNGCTSTATQAVTVNALPVVSITGLASAYCRDAAPVTLTGTPTGGSFTVDNTAATQFVPGTSAIGAHSVGYVYTDANGCTNNATQSVQVNPLPFLSITGLASAYCRDAAALTLTATPTGGSFTIDGSPATSFNPALLAVGNRSVDYRYTDSNGCSNTATQIVTIKAVPPTPTLLTQSSGAYPASQSAVTVDVNSGNVNLVVGNCAGTIAWSGPGNTSGSSSIISVPTDQPGSFTYQATCSVNGCTSPLATAVVTVGGRLTVLHRDVDNYADNNSIQPLIQLQNQGLGSLPLSSLTLRYYLTVEGASALSNLSINYAQVGNQNVVLRYVPLSPAQQGAAGYVEYSFTAGAGSLASGASSGPIQAYFAKSDYAGLNELDDYSYALVRNQLAGNLRITAYYNGVLIAGIEPGSATQVRALRALTESKNGPSATQINTYLEIRNEGNVAINYSDLRARYYFTSDGNERLQVEVDEGNVSTQLVALNPAVGNANYYLEIRFNQGGQLAPGASTGRVRYRISKPDGGRFDQTNDYSYQEQPAESSANSRVVVYVGEERLWGREPGAAYRLAVAEPAAQLEVTLLGNPVQGELVRVQIRGAGTGPLQLQLVSAQGRVITQRQIAGPQALEQHELSVAGQGPGVLLLQVSTPTQRQTIRVLKVE